MIKCPNCGSTTQVKIRSTCDTYSADIHMKYSHCECGCGCDFFHSIGENGFNEPIKECYYEAKTQKLF